MAGHHRESDPPGSLYRVTREVPLTWLIGLVAAGIAQAALIYFKQNDQEKLLTGLRDEIRILNTAVTAKDLKDVEHDLRIADLQRRMLIQEARK